jgi:7-keto-8-aminopelargonate synthetase-like enzyme
MIDIIAAAIGKTIPGYDGAIPGDSIMASTLRDAARAVLAEFTKHDGIAEVIPPQDYKA